jgi:hypothetical protein
MIYISYYTKNTPYEKVMKKYLLPTLKKFKLPYDIEGIINLGSWQKNTHIKAKFIKKMLLKHKQPVIFLDADATIEREPVLFETLKDYDIAVHYFDWMKFWRGVKNSPKRETLSGTMYLNYNKNVLNFLDKWIEINDKNTRWEQKNMKEALAICGNKLKIYDLPIQYVAIIKFNGKVPNYIKNPVIIHHQASRKYKRKV